MDRNVMRDKGTQAQGYIAAGNSYFNRADAAASATAAGATWPVDPIAQDIEDKLQADDKAADVARLQAAGVECYGRAKTLIDEVLAPPA